jgi:probable F420-dependent oxidoreductase
MRIGTLLIDPMGAGSGVSAAPGFVVEYARHAEELGYDSLWLADHVVAPVEYSTWYPFQDYDGQRPEDWKPFPLELTDFPDPLIALAAAAGVTSKLLLCTGVLVLSARNPLVLAKQAATLDQLSGGRLRLGVGLGWWREEIEAVGGPWRDRARFVEETIAAMRRLWTEDEASFDGELVKFPAVRCLPRPFGQSGIPILMGGNNERGARRAGRLAEAYIPHPPGPESDYLVEIMREAASEAGRDPAAVELIALVPDGDRERIEQLRDNGFSEAYVIAHGTTLEQAKQQLEELAERLF